MPGAETFRASADAYDRHVGRYGSQLASALIAFAGIEPGMRALDVGCGPGALTAALEMARVTRPGGVVASCVWDYAGEMTLLRAFWDAAREVDPARAAAVDEGIVMRWCGDGELEELWWAAGLRNVRFGPLVVRASYADFEDLWSPLPTGVTPSGAFCKSLDADRRDALRDAYRRRLGVSDGPFELTARAWAVAGIAP
jgi:SAM-dependent methyltransferase